jgi:hypothetical protein
MGLCAVQVLLGGSDPGGGVVPVPLQHPPSLVYWVGQCPGCDIHPPAEPTSLNHRYICCGGWLYQCVWVRDTRTVRTQSVSGKGGGTTHKAVHFVVVHPDQMCSIKLCFGIYDSYQHWEALFPHGALIHYTCCCCCMAPPSSLHIECRSFYKDRLN